MWNNIQIRPRDPIISRDSRPFGNGGRMWSHDWLLPSVTAGTVRYMIGCQSSLALRDPNANVRTQAQQTLLENIHVAGPMPSIGKELLYPQPRDCQIEGQQVNSLRPGLLAEGEGTNLRTGLKPPVSNAQAQFKAESGTMLWTAKALALWMCDARGDKTSAGSMTPGYQYPEHETRIHVSIDPETGTAQDGALYSTDALSLATLADSDGRLQPFDQSSDLSLQLRVFNGQRGELPDAVSSTSGRWHPVGGEQRLAWWEQSADDAWGCPAEIAAALESNPSRLRMVSATPAIFTQGWCPDWIDLKTLEGTIPQTSIRVRLVSACVDRWIPVSGWSMAIGGPKAIRRAVPAGSVYFFETFEGSEQPISALKSLWLNSVCCDGNGQLTQEGRDGFGLAVWGVWDSHRS